MINLEPKDYERAQELMRSMSSLSDNTKKFWKNYVAQYCDKDSKTALEATATAIKGLKEHKALFLFLMMLLNNEHYQSAWKKYCDTKKCEGDLKKLLKDVPGIDLHVRLFEETKCFALERDNPLFKLPPPYSAVNHIIIALKDPGNQKLHEIYQKFGNGKQVPKKSIAATMQQILNVYRIRTEVVGKCSLKLPLTDYYSTLAATSVLDSPEEVENMMHKLL